MRVVEPDDFVAEHRGRQRYRAQEDLHRRLAGVASGGFARKTELADLMNISDPHDLNGDGTTGFTFPNVTIDSVRILDSFTLLVINDNNYPDTGGRDTNSDHTEFLKIRLDQRLNVGRQRHDDEGDDDRHHEWSSACGAGRCIHHRPGMRGGRLYP